MSAKNRKTVVVELSLDNQTRQKNKYSRKFGCANVVTRQRATTGNMLLDASGRSSAICKKRAKEFHDFLFHNATGEYYQALKAEFDALDVY